MQDNEADIRGLGLSMDTLTKLAVLEIAKDLPRERFLPPESPLTMATQPFDTLSRRRHKQSGAPVRVRRACIFIGTASLTLAGCYEMYEVLQVGGVTLLEWMVLVLFVLLFAWIAFSFMSALAGFAVLLFR